MKWFIGVLSLLFLGGCSAVRFIPEGERLLDAVDIKADTSSIQTSQLSGFMRQHPNVKWFGCLKVPLGVYCMSGNNEKRWINKALRRLGEAPVIYDTDLAEKTRFILQGAVRNMGYLDANVELQEKVKKHKIKVRFQIHPHELYHIRNVTCDIQDTCVARVLNEQQYVVGIQPDTPFNASILDTERDKISNILLNNGFYYFNKTSIYFEADTTIGNRQVDVHMVLTDHFDAPTQTHSPHRQYRIGNIDYVCERQDSTPLIRKGVIHTATEFQRDSLYRDEEIQKTYERFMRLSAVLNTNIHFQKSATDSTRLDAKVSMTPAKPNSIALNLEGTNSAGDFGAAVAASYVSKNLFRGSEQLSVKVRGAYEAIRNLQGYSNQNFLELGTQVALTFPDFKLPFLSRKYRRSVTAASELAFMYDSQNRPEFYRRVLTASWRYRWKPFRGAQTHRFDLLDLNYVFMPWISDTFYKQYLANPSDRNAILRYNYENLFIMKWGYSFTYNSLGKNVTGSNYGTNAYVVRFSVETAGNLLYGISKLADTHQNSEGQYTLFNIAYAQYGKVDFDFSKSFRLNERNSLALHVGLGMALPYGNSHILPYEKRYFSGGANSVRGWSVRGLGPGSFRGTDGRIDFINQTGDIKLDFNFEYRAHIFWKIDCAVFIDAGNIWTFRDYAEQPGGQFRFDTFYKQIAVAYGLGLRLNFNYFILRFDGGMKAINPAYSDPEQHYPIAHPNFSRDFAFHFAVGLPF